jgi:hypothetical protein
MFQAGKVPQESGQGNMFKAPIANNQAPEHPINRQRRVPALLESYVNSPLLLRKPDVR